MSVARHIAGLARSHVDSTPHKFPAWMRAAKFKMTIWLTAAEYIVLMRQSAAMSNGKLSVHKFLKEAFRLEDAEDHVEMRELRSVIRNMRVAPVEPDELEERRRGKGLKTRRRGR